MALGIVACPLTLSADSISRVSYILQNVIPSGYELGRGVGCADQDNFNALSRLTASAPVAAARSDLQT